MWPQVVFLAMTLVGLGIALQRHGQPRTGTESIWGSLIGQAIVLGLMYWGGFFDCFFRR